MTPSGRKIGILDDDPSALMIATEILEDEGFDPIPFGEADDCIAYFLRERADAILMDRRLGETDGLHVLSAIRLQQPGLPALIVSGEEPEEIVPVLPAHPPTGFLQKPFAPDDLPRHLRSLLAKTATPAAEELG
jgi:two-component system, NtrC family, nitrogen regulation response regulator NtrX